MNRVPLSESHERGINLPPLRRLLAYQKLRQRIIYETCLAGFRLRSVDAGDTRISRCNSLEIKTDYSQRAGARRSLDPRAAGEGKLAVLKMLFEFFPRHFLCFCWCVRACVCFFSIFPWMQAKCGGSHGDISIAATELCSLFTIWCKIVNVRFNCLLFSASCHVVPWISILICVTDLEKCGENSLTLSCNKDKRLNTLSLTSTGKNIRTENKMPKFNQSTLN